MNSIYFFYDIFKFQELVLKLNNLDFENIVTVEKCLLYKPLKGETVNQNLNMKNNDLRYVFEFLTNSKVVKAINKKFICFTKLNKYNFYDLSISLSYLVFSRANLILENLQLDRYFPVIQKNNQFKVLLNDNNKNYMDLKFNNGLDFPFLSDNEYISFLDVNFYMRFIFKKNKKKDNLITFKQFIFFSLIGYKFCLLSK